MKALIEHLTCQKCKKDYRPQGGRPWFYIVAPKDESLLTRSCICSCGERLDFLVKKLPYVYQ